MKTTHHWIGRLFWTGAVLTFFMLLSCAIGLVLLAVGDDRGASGVWGVALVAGSAWVLNFIAVVALLAWRTMHEPDADRKDHPPS